MVLIAHCFRGLPARLVDQGARRAAAGECKAGAAVYGAFQHLQPSNVPFSLGVAPGYRQRRGNYRPSRRQIGCEGLDAATTQFRVFKSLQSNRPTASGSGSPPRPQALTKMMDCCTNSATRAALASCRIRARFVRRHGKLVLPQVRC